MRKICHRLPLKECIQQHCSIKISWIFTDINNLRLTPEKSFLKNNLSRSVYVATTDPSCRHCENSNYSRDIPETGLSNFEVTKLTCHQQCIHYRLSLCDDFSILPKSQRLPRQYRRLIKKKLKRQKLKDSLKIMTSPVISNESSFTKTMLFVFYFLDNNQLRLNTFSGFNSSALLSDMKSIFDVSLKWR